MKRNLIFKTALALGLSAAMLLSPMTAMAGTAPESPQISRTKAWDGIEYSLGGLPESVTKIEYAGSVFYLGKDVTEKEFTAVLDAGPESVRLSPPQDNGKLYQYPVYILWNSDKTVLLVHPIIFDNDKILDAVAIPADLPASLVGAETEKTKTQTELTDEQEYMLSDEYADAVRTEFYRLLNEHRAAHGLRELEVNLELQDYADIRADEQRTNFGHIRPSGGAAGSGWHDSKNNVNTRYAENASDTGALGSNPASTALGIFTAWRDSEGHNRHMLYKFDPKIEMGFGIAPKLDADGFVTSGAIFSTGY